MNYLLAELNQNTFLIYDCLDSQAINPDNLEEMHHQLVKEGRDDILILMDGEKMGDQYSGKVLLLGLDGEFGEFCGNGSLCCALYLYQKYPDVQHFKLITSHGEVLLNKHGNHYYSVTLPFPKFGLNPKFVTNADDFGKLGDLTYVEMIEPHVVMKGALTDNELSNMGRELNAKKQLFPLGINVSAWCPIDENSIYVKTYERGVQRLTKSCGTGAMSCITTTGKEGVFKVFSPGGQTEITLSKNEVHLKGLPLIDWTKTLNIFPAFMDGKDDNKKVGT